MPPPPRHDQEFLELPEDDLSSEHLDTQVQKAQEQLVALKRQQDQIERQKRELEELSRRQEHLQAGRAEMVEKLTRTMVVLERETYDAQKRVELLQGINDTFANHLHTLESINPKEWEGLDINRELTKALSAVDDAKTEFHRSLPKISPEGRDDASEAIKDIRYSSDQELAERSFGYWLKAGFAFTLPLFVVGIALAVLLVVFINH